MAERATSPHPAIRITAPDCWAGCTVLPHSSLPVAPSHLIYPLTDTPVEKKILQNTFKVTEQMGVLSPVKWTRWTEHCRANQETMQPGNTKIAEPITMEQSYNEYFWLFLRMWNCKNRSDKSSHGLGTVILVYFLKIGIFFSHCRHLIMTIVFTCKHFIAAAYFALSTWRQYPWVGSCDRVFQFCFFLIP